MNISRTKSFENVIYCILEAIDGKSLNSPGLKDHAIRRKLMRNFFGQVMLLNVAISIYDNLPSSNDIDF